MNVKKTVDNVNELLAKVQALTDHEVLVGVPDDKSDRKKGEMTNAQLAYIHEFGSPAANIPARPFIYPGMKRAKNAVVAIMRKAAKDVLATKNIQAGKEALERVGMTTRNAIVREIGDPTPAYEPLKYSTIRARLRKTAAGRRRLKGGKAAVKEWAGQSGNIKPLIDTGALRAAISYVVRKRGAKE